MKSKGGQNPEEITTPRPPAPQGSGDTTQPFSDHVTRRMHHESDHFRQESICGFILGNHQTAHDMRCLCQLRRELPAGDRKHLDETIRIYEDNLTKQFREYFGHEMIIPADQPTP